MGIFQVRPVAVDRSEVMVADIFYMLWFQDPEPGLPGPVGSGNRVAALGVELECPWTFGEFGP